MWYLSTLILRSSLTYVNLFPQQLTRVQGNYNKSSLQTDFYQVVDCTWHNAHARKKIVIYTVLYITIMHIMYTYIK